MNMHATTSSALAPTFPTPTVVPMSPLEKFNHDMSLITHHDMFNKIPDNWSSAVLIDGANFGSTCNALKLSPDYLKLQQFFRKHAQSHVSWYFNGQDDTSAKGHAGQSQKLLTWLDHNHFRVVTKPIKTIQTAEGVVRKANMDVELTCVALDSCQNAKHIILFTGDGDFTCLVKHLQDRDILVTVVSTEHPNVPVLADELRRAADNFIDIAALAKYISRDSSGAV